MGGRGGGGVLPRKFTGSYIRFETVSKRSCVLLPRSLTFNFREISNPHLDFVGK